MRWRVVAALLGTAAFSGGAGVLLPFDPWIGFGVAGALLCATVAVVCPPLALKRLFAIAAATLVAITGIEAAMAARAALAPAERYMGNYASDAYWNNDDPVLGYGPRAGAVGTSTKMLGEREIYRATYSIAPDGLRRTASGGPSPTAPNCMFFFGDSITFGEGLDDRDTLPWLLQERAGVEWRVFNFGFHGYGPHQMLAAIESGRMQKIVGTCAGRRVVIAQYSEQHAGRALGRDSWDVDGPWFVPDARGRVARAGRFDQRPGTRPPIFAGRFRPALVDWWEWRRLFVISDSDRRFFVSLMATAHDELNASYPGAEWHLILLDTEPNTFVSAGLQEAGIAVHPILSILPDWRPLHPDFSIPVDGHPNRRYNDALATWIRSTVVGAHP